MTTASKISANAPTKTFLLFMLGGEGWMRLTKI
jgi:hypothetical protein